MDWIETIVNGLLVGGLYGLFGLGAAFTFGIAKIVNVAHGEFIVLAGFIGVLLVAIIPIHPLLLLPLVLGIVFCIGYLFQALLLNRVVGKDPLPPMLMTFGVSIILKNLMVQIFGATPRSINVGGLRFAGMDVFGLRLGVLPIIIFGIATSLFVALHFNATETGKNEVAGPETYCITPVGAASSNAQGEGGNSGATTANRYENKSLLLAYQMEKSLVRNLGAEDRGVRRARFAVLRDAAMPAILIEGGYMTNPTEGKKIYDAVYRKQMAAAIVRGIVAYQKLTAPPVSPPPKPAPAGTSKAAGAKKTK